MKKIQAGLYEYKGHTVELVEGTWLITNKYESSPHDAANTKQQAAEMIDRWEEIEADMQAGEQQAENAWLINAECSGY